MSTVAITRFERGDLENEALKDGCIYVLYNCSADDSKLAVIETTLAGGVEGYAVPADAFFCEGRPEGYREAEAVRKARAACCRMLGYTPMRLKIESVINLGSDDSWWSSLGAAVGGWYQTGQEAAAVVYSHFYDVFRLSAIEYKENDITLDTAKLGRALKAYYPNLYNHLMSEHSKPKTRRTSLTGNKRRKKL